MCGCVTNDYHVQAIRGVDFNSGIEYSLVIPKESLRNFIVYQGDHLDMVYIFSYGSANIYVGNTWYGIKDTKMVEKEIDLYETMRHCLFPESDTSIYILAGGDTILWKSKHYIFFNDNPLARTTYGNLQVSYANASDNDTTILNKCVESFTIKRYSKERPYKIQQLPFRGRYSICYRRIKKHRR